MPQSVKVRATSSHEPEETGPSVPEPSLQMPPDSARWATVVGSALAMLVLGVSRVRDQSYWVDEAVSAAVVRRSFGGLLRVLWSQEAGMGPYYFGLWLWSQAFDTDVGLRMFSVVGMAIAIALACDLAWRWLGAAEAIAVSAVMLANPFLLRYLTEVRTYSWVMAFSVGLVWALDRWRTNPSVAWTGGVGVLTGLLVATHLAAAPFVAALALAVVLTTDRDIWWRPRTLSIPLITALMFATAIPVMLARNTQIDWVPAMSPSVVWPVVEKWLGGPWWAHLITTGVILFAIAGGRTRPWPRAALLCGAALAPALIGVVSLYRSLWVYRYLAPAFPLAIMAAVAGGAAAWRWLAARASWSKPIDQLGAVAIATAALISLVAAGPFVDRSQERDGMQDAVNTVESMLGPGDQVVAIHQETMSMYHYLGFRKDVAATLVAAPGDHRLYPVEATIPEVADRLQAAPKVFVFRNPRWKECCGVAEAMKGRKLTTKQFDRVAVEIYEAPATE